MNLMAKPKTILKKKKKEWYEIVSPKEFGSRVIGETPADDASKLIGRTLTINLSRVIGDMKKQNINIDFIITDTKEGKCSTSVKKFWMQPYSIKRMVRVGVDRIDESVIYRTKDGINVRIRPLLVTRLKVKSSIRKALRKVMLHEIKKIVERSNYNQLIQALVTFNLQKDLKAKLNKIYPLKSSQIRSMEIVKVKKRFVREEVKPEIKEEKTVEKKEAEEKKEVKEKPKAVKKEAKKAETKPKKREF